MFLKSLKQVYASPGQHVAFTDITTYQDRYYLAFKSGPQHMVNSKNYVKILSSQDGEKWKENHTISCNKDTRDPKFMVFKGNLYCFYFTIEPSSLDRSSSQKQRYKVASYFSKTSDGENWSQPQYIARDEKYWHPVAHEEHAYCVTHPKDPSPQDLCYLKSSQDCLVWETLAEIPIPYTEKPNEAHLTFDQTGKMFILIRCDQPPFNAYLLTSQAPYRSLEKISLGRRMGGPLIWFDPVGMLHLGCRFFTSNGQPHSGIFTWSKEQGLELELVLPSLGDSSYMGHCRCLGENASFISYYSSHESNPIQSFDYNEAAIYILKILDSLPNEAH